MGQFISNCKGCDKKFMWFLKASPKICACGVLNTAQEIQESWDRNYLNGQVASYKHRLANGEAKGIDYLLQHFSADFAQEIFDEANKHER